jgi:hypothetical protein
MAPLEKIDCSELISKTSRELKSTLLDLSLLMDWNTSQQRLLEPNKINDIEVKEDQKIQCRIKMSNEISPC